MHLCQNSYSKSELTSDVGNREITTHISWDNKASGDLVYKYGAAVLYMPKQYDWEHRPIINGGESDPFVHPTWKRKDLHL